MTRTDKKLKLVNSPAAPGAADGSAVRIHKSISPFKANAEGQAEGIVGMRLYGDCMDPTISPDGFVIVDTTQVDWSAIQEGRIYAAHVNGKPMVKRMRWHEPGKTLFLTPDNLLHEPFYTNFY
jgi:phage repressor protein C with HTH and peptisase S24 domain